jgi:hypothetical protein
MRTLFLFGIIISPLLRGCQGLKLYGEVASQPCRADKQAAPSAFPLPFTYLARLPPHFAHIDNKSYYWVDALCIDQKSLQERNHQVGIMGQIYSRAQHVFACVGPHADDSEYLVDVLDKKRTLFQNTWSSMSSRQDRFGESHYETNFVWCSLYADDERL